MCSTPQWLTPFFCKACCICQHWITVKEEVFICHIYIAAQWNSFLCIYQLVRKLGSERCTHGRKIKNAVKKKWLGFFARWCNKTTQMVWSIIFGKCTTCRVWFKMSWNSCTAQVSTLCTLYGSGLTEVHKLRRREVAIIWENTNVFMSKMHFTVLP